VLFRELDVRPPPSERRLLVPYFSLYSRDTRAPDDPPLLCQILDRYGQGDPLGMFVENIVGPIQDAWVYLTSQRGVLPELHGQNALLELSADGEPRRVIHRDFQSLYSDGETRNQKGLPQFTKHVIGSEDNIKKEEQYSLVFDHFIGGYLTIRLVEVFVEKFADYSVETVSAAIASRFRSIKNNRLDVFPHTTYRFADKIMIDNEVALIPTGQKPLFR
jgi:hypothetical protein